MAETSFSIVDALLGGVAGSNGPGSTKFLRGLLKTVAYDAMNASSNVLTNYAVVEMASRICEQTEMDLTTLDAIDDGEVYFNTYKSCMQRIRRTEEVLVLLSTGRNVDVEFEQEDVLDCLTHMAYWEESRSRLQEAIRELSQQSELRQSGSMEASSSNLDTEQKQDDSALLHIVVRLLEKPVPGAESHSVSDALSKLRHSLSDFNDGLSSNSETVVIAIKSAWLARVAFVESVSSSKGMRGQYLGGSIVGEKLSKLIRCFETKSFGNLASTYTEYVRTLIGTAAPR